MRKKEQLDRLRSVPVFQSLSKRELTSVLATAKEVEFLEGNAIVQEGTKAVDFFVILDGRANVSVGGRKKTTLGPGDYFGEMSALDGGPRTATVTADTRVWALRLESAAFLPLVGANPSMAKKILLELARRLRESERSVTH